MNSGQQLWSQDAFCSKHIHSNIGSTLFFRAEDPNTEVSRGIFIAVDVATGVQPAAWARVAAAHENIEEAKAAGGHVLIEEGGKVYIYGPDATLKWTVPKPDPKQPENDTYLMRATYGDGALLRFDDVAKFEMNSMFDNGCIRCIKARSGQERWRVNIDDMPFRDLAVIGDVVLMCGRTSVRAFDIRTGEKMPWSVPADSALEGPWRGLGSTHRFPERIGLWSLRRPSPLFFRPEPACCGSSRYGITPQASTC